MLTIHTAAHTKCMIQQHKPFWTSESRIVLEKPWQIFEEVVSNRPTMISAIQTWCTCWRCIC